MHIHVYNAQREVRRFMEAKQTVNPLHFRQKKIWIRRHRIFKQRISSPNLRVLVKHHLPTVTGTS